ncbi:MAG: prepilin-type N-terminal cleavage/methylation domain-containing protein [Candidatus Carbobacillus altaicus]|nr:prepilin-type N-terminal cleavage/methylation domain-containing protein [Candidatus Carbobacillus altaicus]
MQGDKISTNGSRSSRYAQEAGVTLIEIMIVLGIIALLSAMLLPHGVGLLERMQLRKYETTFDRDIMLAQQVARLWTKKVEIQSKGVDLHYTIKLEGKDLLDRPFARELGLLKINKNIAYTIGQNGQSASQGDFTVKTLSGKEQTYGPAKVSLRLIKK